MEAISSITTPIRSSIVLTDQFIPLKPLFSRSTNQASHFRKISCASRRDHHHQNHDRSMVDENMIVLRMRIREVKMAERNIIDDDEDFKTSNWMQWEKRYYPNYNSDVFEAVGALQTHLMNTRPSLALAMVVVFAMSVPASMAMVLFHFVEVAKWVLSGIHVLIMYVV